MIYNLELNAWRYQIQFEVTARSQSTNFRIKYYLSSIMQFKSKSIRYTNNFNKDINYTHRNYPLLLSLSEILRSAGLKPQSRRNLKKGSFPNVIISKWNLFEEYSIHKLARVYIHVTLAPLFASYYNRLIERDAFKIFIYLHWEKSILRPARHRADHSLACGYALVNSWISTSLRSEQPAFFPLSLVGRVEVLPMTASRCRAEKFRVSWKIICTDHCVNTR